MTRSEINAAVVSAWRAEPACSAERALELAQSVLANEPPKVREDFEKWFRKLGATALARVNG